MPNRGRGNPAPSFEDMRMEGWIVLVVGLMALGILFGD